MSHRWRPTASGRKRVWGFAIPAALGARSRFVAIVPIFGVLLLVSAVFAPSSVKPGQVQSLLYFAAILGFAALGQHLIITIGGLDLSVGPVITLSALVFTIQAAAAGGSVTRGVLAALLVGAVVGTMNGLTVTVLRVTPLIATLGGGAIATGLAYTFNGQGAPVSVPDSVNQFLARTPLGIPLPAAFWIGAVAVVALTLRYTIAGRRFTAVGSNPRAGRALGIRVDAYKVSAYVVGGILYGAAGILVAVAVTTPGLGVGTPYLLPSIAAVVIGGTALGGGVGSAVATAIGTLFVVQLNNFTLALNGDVAVQQIAQGAVIIVAMAIYSARMDLSHLGWSGKAAPKAGSGPPERREPRAT